VRQAGIGQTCLLLCIVQHVRLVHLVVPVDNILTEVSLGSIHSTTTEAPRLHTWTCHAGYQCCVLPATRSVMFSMCVCGTLHM
jgi:hypothetical protein